MFRLLRALINAILVGIALIWLVSLAGVVIYSFRDQREPGDVIMVLGAAQYAGKPSPVLKARIDHAILVWQADTSRMVMFTGGTGPGDVTSEAEVSRTYARRQGVPNRRILLETEGRTTSESMKRAAELLHARKQGAVILVSDPFHMFRLRLLAYRHGLEAVTSPTQTSPIEVRSMRNLKYIVSESFKAPAAFLLE